MSFGGFDDPDFSQSANRFSESQTNSGRRSLKPSMDNSKRRPLIPVTARQIRTACNGVSPGDEIVIFESCAHRRVDILGFLGDPSKVKTDEVSIQWPISCAVSSDEIMVKYYTEEDGDQSRQHILDTFLRTRSYMRVIGAIRVTGEGFYVSAYRVIAISDPDEIAAHLIGVSFSAHSQSDTGNVRVDTTCAKVAPAHSTVTTTDTKSDALGVQGNGEVDESTIYNIIKNTTKEFGHSVAEMIQMFPKADVRGLLECLIEDGQVYETDTDCYRVT